MDGDGGGVGGDGDGEDVAIVLVSWQRDWEFWKAEARRGVVGLDFSWFFGVVFVVILVPRCFHFVVPVLFSPLLHFCFHFAYSFQLALVLSLLDAFLLLLQFLFLLLHGFDGGSCDVY